MPVLHGIDEGLSLGLFIVVMEADKLVDRDAGHLEQGAGATGILGKDHVNGLEYFGGAG